MLKKDKTKPFRVEGSTGPTAEDMLMNCAISKLKADRTPIPDNRFTLPPEYGVAGGGESSDPFNGHEYVDLGLPSGTLWAKMNVGAESEKDAGLYFAWGETQGYADASTKAFSWSDYKFNPSGDGSTMSKYNATDGLIVLDLEDDAARANWGGEWHIPTKEQCDELFNTTYVTNAWVTDYNGSGINGRLFTSVINGNTMFLPAAGSCEDGEVVNVGIVGSVWASALSSENVKSAWGFNFGGGRAGVSNGRGRYGGQSVRGVVGQMDEIEDETPSPGQPTT